MLLRMLYGLWKIVKGKRRMAMLKGSITMDVNPGIRNKTPVIWDTSQSECNLEELLYQLSNNTDFALNVSKIYSM